MKILLAFILVLSSLHGYGQKKGKVDPKDVTIDSLTNVTVVLSSKLDSTSKASSALSMNLDSISKDLVRYQGMYTTIKEKVVKYDFDPADMGVIIDSLKTSRDAAFSGLTATSTAMADSVSVLTKENAALKEMMTILQADAGNKEKLVAELKQLKELLDSKIITQAEFDDKKSKLMAKW